MANKPTKAELQAKLTELNISYPETATVKELAALLPPTDEQPPAGNGDEAGQVAPPRKKSPNQAEVVNPTNGNLIRVYTLDEHGKDFEALAHIYAEKVHATVRLR